MNNVKMETGRPPTHKTRLKVRHALPTKRSTWMLTLSTLLALCQAAFADIQWATSFSHLLSRLTDAKELPAVPLHLLPCGNVSDRALTSILLRLPCPQGCTVAETCHPCHQHLISSLFRPPGGVLLLWAAAVECLYVPEELMPSYWAGTAVFLVPPREMGCSNALSLPLFAKTPFPLCAKRDDGGWKVWRRITVTTRLVNVRKIARLTSGMFTITGAGLAQTENLRGVTLRIRFLNYFPYVYCTNFTVNSTCPSPLPRPETSIISALGEHLNFSTELRQHPRRVWGSQDVNGTWHGLLASIARDEADIAIGGMSVTALRANAVQFLREFTIVRSMFVSRKPPAPSAYLTVLAPIGTLSLGPCRQHNAPGWCTVSDAEKMPL